MKHKETKVVALSLWEQPAEEEHSPPRVPVTQLRERLEQYGTQALTTHQLLFLALGGQDKDAQLFTCLEALLTTYTTAAELLTLDFGQLAYEHKLGKVKAAQLRAVFELARRVMLPTGSPTSRYRITAAQEAAAFLAPHMANLDHEELRVLILNTRNEVVANLLLYVGTINSSVLRIAEIMRPAITRNCPHVIVCHNHPSGDPTPSPEDIQVTQQLVDAGKLMDIEVLDHIIIGSVERFASLKELLKW